MRYPFHEFQADFRQLVNAIEFRNQLYHDAKECGYFPGCTMDGSCR